MLTRLTRSAEVMTEMFVMTAILLQFYNLTPTSRILLTQLFYESRAFDDFPKSEKGAKSPRACTGPVHIANRACFAHAHRDRARLAPFSFSTKSPRAVNAL